MRSDAKRALLFAFALAAGGCAVTHVKGSAADGSGDAAHELDFWQAVGDGSLLTNHDALHGLFLLADGKDDAKNWAERRQQAVARGWINASDALDADGAARIGLVSVAVCEMLDIRGGATMHVFGRSQRYCTNELVFTGLLPQRSPGQVLRGIEFVDLAGRVDDYRKKHARGAGGGT